MRTLLAFIIAPLSIGAIAFGLTFAITGLNYFTLGATLIFTIYAYVVALIFGLPLYLLLKKRIAGRYSSYVKAAVILSVVSILNYSVIPLYDRFTTYPNWSPSWTTLISLLLEGSVYPILLSLFAVSIFWIIVRPDHSSNKPENQ